MTDPNRPAIGIRIGSRVITGRAAALILVAMLGGLVALLIWKPPPLRMAAAAAIWLVFVGYWSVAARNAAATVSGESAASRAVHTRLLNLSLLLLFISVPGLRWRFLPLTPVVTGIGIGVQVLFLFLAVWARRHLGRNWSGAVTVKTDHQLVRSGPYRLLRHPIYTAMLGMYAGVAVTSGELHALLAVLMVTGAYLRKIPIEERTLGGVFGAEYEAYRRKSWALVPGLY